MKRPFIKTIMGTVAAAALICVANGDRQSAWAGERGERGREPAFASGMINHMQKMRRFRDASQNLQNTPAIINKLDVRTDPNGQIASFQPNGATITANSAFFQDLGTNQRTCFSCHQPQNGWGISAADVSTRFDISDGTDPVFRLVDGATCPTDDVSTLDARRAAYTLLINKGLIRIGLPLPDAATLEFEVTSVVDPYNCNTNATTGLTSKTTGIVSVYRRPLPSTNVGFLTAIMWDGREPSLEQQAVDATLGHAQAANPPTADQVAQIVAFQQGIFTAQQSDNEAGSLVANNATGGPVALSLEIAKFFVGINDPVGQNPTNAPFDPNIFNLFTPWLAPQAVASAAPAAAATAGATPAATADGSAVTSDATASTAAEGTEVASADNSTALASAADSTSVLTAAATGTSGSGSSSSGGGHHGHHGHDRHHGHHHNNNNAAIAAAAQQAIARGQVVFNTANITISGVRGLNDTLNVPSVAGFCGTCHDTPNVGNHSVKLPLDIGIPDAGADAPPALDITGLPVFTLTCMAGPLAGQVFTVTDPGRALISGKCADIGRFKGPILRGLASRAPFFHNGSAATLADVVDFYDLRFAIGLTVQQKADLVAFLEAL